MRAIGRRCRDQWLIGVSKIEIIDDRKALRQAIIVRILAVERLFRAVIIALAAYAVWKFRGARGAIQATLDRDLPIFRAAGFKVDQMTIVHELEKALATAGP